MAKRKSNTRTERPRGKSSRKQNPDVSQDTRRSSNPIEWHNHNPSMLHGAANLPFAQVLGTVSTIPETQSVSAYADIPVPGLISMEYIPVPGMPNSMTDAVRATIVAGQEQPELAYNAPINVAARDVFSFVRHENSGSTNYEAPNLMMYLMAMDSIYSFHGFMARAYAALMLYTAKNRYLPRVLLTAMGLDFESFYGNLAQFRYFINNYAARASVLCVPDKFDLFRRHYWMNQNVYADGQTQKAQLYMFVPKFFWQYKLVAATAQVGAGALVPTKNFGQGQKYTLNDIMEIGNNMLDLVLMNEDFNIMSGDILKAYSRDQLYSLAPLPSEFELQIVYDETTLSAIHNATIHTCGECVEFATSTVGAQSAKTNFRISERIPVNQVKASYLVLDTDMRTLCGPSGTGYTKLSPFVSANRLLNMHKDDVTPEDVMEATRFMTAGINYQERNSAAAVFLNTVLDGVGSEIIASAYIWRNVVTNEGIAPVAKQFSSWMTHTADYDEVVRYISMFDQAPVIAQVTAPTVSTAAPWVYSAKGVVAGWHGNMENYTFVSHEVLKRIHETSLLSLFDVPHLGHF